MDLGGQFLLSNLRLHSGFRPRYGGFIPGATGAFRSNLLKRSASPRVDKDPIKLPQSVISCRSIDRQTGIQRLICCQNLFDKKQVSFADKITQIRQIVEGIRQSVRMVNAYAINETCGDEFANHSVSMFEDDGILLADTRQAVDREETPVTDNPVFPMAKLVVLAIMNLLWRTAFGPGTDREKIAVVAQHHLHRGPAAACCGRTIIVIYFDDGELVDIVG